MKSVLFSELDNETEFYLKGVRYTKIPLTSDLYNAIDEFYLYCYITEDTVVEITTND